MGIKGRLITISVNVLCYVWLIWNNFLTLHAEKEPVEEPNAGTPPPVSWLD